MIRKLIILNLLFVSHNKKETNIAYKSKYNHKCKNQVILLLITDCKKWHCLVVRSLSALFKGITSSGNGDFLLLQLFSFISHT